MELLIDFVLLGFLLVIAVAIAYVKDLLAAVMFSGIYGLLSASFFVAMGAVDVAFTEAAVGAGISPLLMLAVLALVGRFQKPDSERATFALLLVTLVGGLLIVATLDMPGFGSPEAPAQQHVAPRYISESMREIGIPNIVTSVLASYRAYDTLGEVVVILTAGLGVLGLLAGFPGGSPSARYSPPIPAQEHNVLKIISKILIPPILIFALYVQFHGEYGPGGGFQAGVIFAVGFILYAMVFGLDLVQKVVGNSLLQIIAAAGVLLYGSVGLLGIVTGNNYLDYNNLAGDPVTGQHIGIIAIELGVGITVASVMMLIFFAFSAQLASGRRK